ncbi:MAG: hypothetical protein JO327_07495 [Nitrososphaeraceae archaeon]|nr:hypothetical protein [Nitrososphaeraceae archaeon]
MVSYNCTLPTQVFHSSLRAQRFVSDSAYIFITGRSQSEPDAAVKQNGKNNVSGV